MSAYQEFVEERDKIDFLIDKGYQIKSVIENLSGAFVEFELKDNERRETKTLHILNAETRKYFSTLLIKQKQYS
ncbi:hypothetical protein LGQ02_11030 [Bacillus shivajii]|uniref:hypothetical protein n=1 Tax=Bacillus shivajii TaxID=1983719 RepID=UPI001CFC2F5E|nr:hypothetical protein [Bacillus shivajii]UCZ51418.1 hypothetical protein LGQ02_11030 [Bacillus shivajii]